MLFLKSTSVTKAPGIYDVDIAAKPPGKTFGVFIATDPDHPPTAVLEKLAEHRYRADARPTSGRAGCHRKAAAHPADQDRKSVV